MLYTFYLNIVVNNQFFQAYKESTILTSYNFARLADFIYAEELTFEQYEMLNKKNEVIVHNDQRIVYIKMEKFNFMPIGTRVIFQKKQALASNEVNEMEKKEKLNTEVKVLNI